MYSVYVLSDPFSGMPRYVGYTADERQRMRRHLVTASSSGTHKERWIASLLASAVQPIMRVVAWCRSAQEAQDNEQWLIGRLRTRCDLTNLTDGGTGGALVGEAKERMRVGVKRWMRTPAGKAAMRKGVRGAHMPDAIARAAATRSLTFATPESNRCLSEAMKASWRANRKTILAAQAAYRLTPAGIEHQRKRSVAGAAARWKKARAIKVQELEAMVLRLQEQQQDVAMQTHDNNNCLLSKET